VTEYFISVFGITAAVSMLGYLVYPRGGELVRSALSVLVLFVALTPLFSLIGSLGTGGIFDPPDFDASEYREDYLEVTREAFCEGLRVHIAERYGISEDEVTVLAEGFSFKEMRAEKIRVILVGKAAFKDGKGIAKYVEGLGYGRCEVEIGIV
jgi:hypothetical protein